MPGYKNIQVELCQGNLRKINFDVFMSICIQTRATNRLFQKLCSSSYFQKAVHPQSGYIFFCLTLSINMQADPQFLVSVQDKLRVPNKRSYLEQNQPAPGSTVMRWVHPSQMHSSSTSVPKFINKIKTRDHMD